MKAGNGMTTLYLTLLWSSLLWAGLAAPWIEPMPQPPPPSAWVLVHIDYATPDQLQFLVDTVDVWEIHHRPDWVLALVDGTQRTRLTELGFHLQVEPPHPEHPLILPPRTPAQAAGIPGYACYRTVDETYADLSRLAQQKPDLVAWQDVGDSWDKITPGGRPGDDIFSLVLTNRARPGPKPIFLLAGAVHARELAAGELATRFGELLLAGYGVDPDLTWLLDYTEIHIISLANPDGRRWAEGGNLWRKNTNTAGGCAFPSYGVDLNRNSSFRWNSCTGSGCSSANACSIFYRGSAPLSEPETAILEHYAASLFPDRRGPGDGDAAPVDTAGLFISLHSYGRLVMYPWDFTLGSAPNNDALRTLGRKFGYYNGHQVCRAGSCLYLFDGSNTDWVYGSLGVPAYTFELGTTFFESCTYFENSLAPGNLKALAYAAKAAVRPYQFPAGPEITNLLVVSTTLAMDNALTLYALADDARYKSNGWGTEAVQTIQAGRLSLDAPPWAGGSLIPMVADDGQFDEPQEILRGHLSTLGWSPGQHTLFVQGQDRAGNWGTPSAIFVHLPLSYGWEVALETPTLFAAPGQTLTHTMVLSNTGNNWGDTLGLTASVVGWPLSVPAVVGPLAPGQSAQVDVVISVPPTAVVGQMDYAILELISQQDPTVRQILTLQTLVDSPTPEAGGALANPSAAEEEVGPIFLPFIRGH